MSSYPPGDKFRQRIEQLIDAFGTTGGFCRFVGIDPASVRRWSAGGNVTIETVEKIARALGVSSSWILGEETGESMPVFKKPSSKLKKYRSKDYQITITPGSPETFPSNYQHNVSENMSSPYPYLLPPANNNYIPQETEVKLEDDLTSTLSLVEELYRKLVNHLADLPQEKRPSPDAIFTAAFNYATTRSA